jgi:hypothetical protein
MNLVFKENGIQDAALKQQISCYVRNNKDKLHAYVPQYTWNNVLIQCIQIPTTSHEVPGSNPGSAVGIFLCRGLSP